MIPPTIGIFTTTPVDYLFGQLDIDAFLTDIKALYYPYIIKEKHVLYPTVEQVLNQCDIAISCPFTSTCINALSSGIPAFWYDPLNKCSDSDYHGTPFLYVGKDGLRRGLEYWLGKSDQEVRAIAREYGNIIDPFCDGEAKQRFRELLL